jgi:hypothetical protein
MLSVTWNGRVAPLARLVLETTRRRPSEPAPVPMKASPFEPCFADLKHASVGLAISMRV